MYYLTEFIKSGCPAPSTEGKVVAVTRKSIGGTIYLVESQISASAKETAYEKVKKLILNSASPEHLKSA